MAHIAALKPLSSSYPACFHCGFVVAPQPSTSRHVLPLPPQGLGRTRAGSTGKSLGCECRGARAPLSCLLASEQEVTRVRWVPSAEVGLRLGQAAPSPRDGGAWSSSQGGPKLSALRRELQPRRAAPEHGACARPQGQFRWPKGEQEDTRFKQSHLKSVSAKPVVSCFGPGVSKFVMCCLPLPPLAQVVTNRDTQETLLCMACVFEVSNSEHGAQHHIYRLVKD